MRLNKILKSTIIFLIVMFISNVIIVYRPAMAVTEAEVDISSGDYSGLFVSGVNDSNVKLGADVGDPHWTFTGVTENSPKPHCQNTARFGQQAKTVFERGDGGYVVTTPEGNRLYFDGVAGATPAFTGNEVGIGAPWPYSLNKHNLYSPDNTFPWSYKSSGARWISQNAYGLHDSSSSCTDPSVSSSGPIVPDHSTTKLSNTFNFKLTNGLTVRSDRNIQVNTLGIRMLVQTDNLIRVKVNGRPLVKSDRRTDYPDEADKCHEFQEFLKSPAGADFICPDFSRLTLSDLSLNGSAGVFKVGTNDVTIEIFSTYSNIGFIIDNISLTGKKKVMVGDVCRPISVKVPAATYYPRVTHTDPKGRSYSTAAVTIPTKASVGGSTVYTNNTMLQVVIDKLNATNYLTTNYTDGDSHTVQYSETASHVYGYTDHYDTVYDRGWITDYTWKPGTCSGKPVKCSPGGYVPSGRHWGIIGSHQVYNGSTTADWTGPASKGSENFGPCYDYKLDANSSNNFPTGGRIESGSTVTINPSVTNASFTQSIPAYSSFYNFYRPINSKSAPTYWQVSFLTLQPGNTTLPSTKVATKNANSACRHFDPSNAYNCTAISSGSMVFTKGYSSPPSVNFTVPDVNAGTKYCFAFSINDSLNPDPVDRWSHAYFSYARNCIIVVKKPKTQIWGGDLFVGKSQVGGSALASKIQSATSVKSGTTYGSWVEYAASAPSTISGVASGAGLNNGKAVSSVCDYTKLTFTSAGASSCTASTLKGGYQSNRLIPDVAASFANSNPVRYVNGSVDVGGLVSGGIYQNTSGSVNITGGNLPSGKWVVINAPNATVTIAGNINYANGRYTKINEIPQLVIIAKDININDNVSKVDSWLIARGNINTCSSAAASATNVNSAQLTISKCATQLTINGPIMANKLYLHRTFGAGTGAGTGIPAEIMNLRSDAYLWAYARARENGGSARVIYSTEAPVRF